VRIYCLGSRFSSSTTVFFTGDCKVPSVVRYDSQGRAVQFGTEAIENKAGFVNTTLVKCFTHHLYPAAMRSAYNNAVPPLPYGVAIKKIYTDFLKYLFEYTQDWVKRSTTIEWDRLKNSYVLVMAIPNGWDGTQQAFLRSVVVDAGALPANHGPNRLRFVSKAEASIHFAAGHEGIGRGLRQGSTIAVCNAGGSTVNTSVYACTSAWPTFELREVTSNECVQAGGIFVDEAARQFLEHKLASSTKYGTPKTINDAVYEFERKTASLIFSHYYLFNSLRRNFRSAGSTASRRGRSSILAAPATTNGLS